MAARVTPLLDEALDLPKDERAELAAKLVASLDDEPGGDVAKAWEDEIGRRVDRVASGEAQGIPWEQVRDELRRRVTRRT
jgi:putative addiction module component (TIGR02574 family)